MAPSWISVVPGVLLTLSFDLGRKILPSSMVNVGFAVSGDWQLSK
jgi:hypothetical protein